MYEMNGRFILYRFCSLVSCLFLSLLYGFHIGYARINSWVSYAIPSSIFVELQVVSLVNRPIYFSIYIQDIDQKVELKILMILTTQQVLVINN